MLCTALVGLYANVAYAQLSANFNSNITSGCSPILVQFNDQSTGNPVNWSWNLGNGTISNLQNPSTTYLNPGTYNVTLTVTDAANNTSTFSNTITAIPSPIVNFVASDTIPQCAPKTIQFTDFTNLGASGAATYFWDFGDGNTSNLQNPIHTYTTPGNYNVTLSVTNSANCIKILTKNNYIKIVNKPNANFNAPNRNSCTLPLTVNFNNTSSGGATTYFWDFGNGNTSVAVNPSTTYNAVGSYPVTLIATNGGCSDTETKTSYVNIGSLTASYTQSTTSICTGNNVTFTNTSQPGPGTSTWYFGDGTNAVSTNATHAYAAPGTYNVMLVVNFNNCSDTATSTVVVNQGPNPQFTANAQTSCSVPFTVNFTNTTVGAVSYVWNFGDGSPTVTTTNPSHTYTSFGNYTVTLTATAANGCSKTISMPNYISVYQAVMTVTANPPSGCAPATINFATSVNPNVPVTNYTWNFGDGSGAIVGGATMSHLYTTPGTYTISVSFTVGQGCTFTSNPITVDIGTKPTANFSATPTVICPGNLVSFTNTSAGPSATTYTWYFGDGSTQTTSATNVTHIYNAQGTYTVSLVANNNGCKDTLTLINLITVNFPSADFSVAYSCTNKLLVSFTDASVGSNATSLSWSWDFGDGSPISTVQNPTHTFPALGTYTVELTVVDAVTGCTSSRQRTITLFDITPQFAANDTEICRNETVFFNAQIPNAQFVSSHNWYYGDGSSSLNSGAAASHVYTVNGNYTVTLITTDVRGCKDTFIRSNYISVYGPTANFTGTPLTGCVPLVVNFTSQSNNGGNTIANYTWRFGDGITNSGNLPNISHSYNANGLYSVTLAVTDNLGCTDSLIRPNYVDAKKPNAAFTVADTFACPGAVVGFTNSSSGTNLTYSWTFGDGGTSNVASPTHTYTSAGVYVVRLIVTDGGGCMDTAIRNMHVTGINLSFTASDTFANCPPLTVNFTNTSSGTGNIVWTFGNGNSSSLNSPSTIYTVPGVYTVKLKAQNGTGCVDSITKTITVLGPTGTFTYAPLSGCIPLTVNFSSVAVNTQSYVWDMDNGVTQTTSANTFSYTYTQPGIYVPRVILRDGSSCQVPIQGIDTVIVDRVQGDFTFNPTSLCQNGTVQFYDTVISSYKPVTTWNWTFGDGGTSTSHNPTHFYATPNTYTVTLVMGTAQGCKDTIIKTITVLPAPTVSAGNGQSLCQGQTLSAQLQATGASSYVWSPAGGLSCSTCPNPVASPSVTTTYTVIGTATNGCKDTSQVTITVNPLPTVVTGPSVTICNGSSVQLSASGATSYVWSPATNLSCTNCPSPTASPSVTTTYTVTGTNLNGCTDTAQIVVVVNPIPSVSAGPPSTMCAGDSVSLQASGATSYSWSPATGLSCTNCANPKASPSTTTTYIVTGASGVGCFDTGMVTVTVNPLPAVSAGNNQSLCLGSTTQLQASGASSYVWSPSTGLSCTSCPNPTVNINTTTTYTVTGTSGAGCVASSQVTVAVNLPPTITASNNTTICEGTSTQLQVSGAATYVWSPAVGLSCINCPNPTASPTTTTTYTVIGTDANGCKDTTQVTINVNPQPTVDAGPDQTVCSLGSVQLQTSGANAYTWSPATGLSCTNCDDPIATPTTTTNYTVTGSDGNGCTNTDDVIVTVLPLPDVDAGADKTICKGESIGLQASGAVNYVWTPATHLSCTNCPSPIATPTSTITYQVKGTDQNGCHDSDKVTITVIQPNPITIGKGDTICKGESTQLNITGGDSYLWFPSTGLNDATIGNPTASPEQTTYYTVVIRQGSCFTDTVTITVVVNPTPTVNAGEDQSILAGTSVMLFATTTNTTDYLWTPSSTLSCETCQNPTATPTETTNYTVKVSNQFGCKAEDDVLVKITCDNTLLFMANIFTPNGDGNNDRFYPQGKGITIVKRFRVYNRWGEMLYEAQNFQPNNENYGWDGMYKGQQLKPDVYVYIVDAVCFTGSDIQQKGDISLIR